MRCMSSRASTHQHGLNFLLGHIASEKFNYFLCGGGCSGWCVGDDDGLRCILITILYGTTDRLFFIGHLSPIMYSCYGKFMTRKAYVSMGFVRLFFAVIIGWHILAWAKHNGFDNRVL